MIDLLRQGSWWIKSKIDPRWNTSGTGDVGAFIIPPDAEKVIEELKKKYGDPPDDLEYGYMKD